jgi:hypothetical protein
VPNVVTDWVIFLFIVFVIAVDDILRELLLSFTATGEFIRHRVRWTLIERLRSRWRRARR